ncbi:acyl carrier protein [Streptococcus moroccensis]|uniref:Acyl carrier protein n=1 Tax=Streptococcus moroccensis TaxID=1451356 RepID=A0ABT9YR25_9STRE|nr:acyl carrier protein [Streptococcus moroccensis]
MSEVKQTIMELTAQAFNVSVEELSLETSFKDELAASSLAMVSLIANIEDELDVMIPLSEAGKFNTVGDVVAFVEAEM